MAQLVTKVELYQDGHREVHHLKADPGMEGWSWNHPDTKAEREACSACTSGTIDSARTIARELEAKR